MDQRAAPEVSPYRIFSRAEWAKLRADTLMTLEPDEVSRLHSMHDRLDISEVDMAELLRVDSGEWRAQLPQLKEHLAKFEQLPSELHAQLEELERRLGA